MRENASSIALCFIFTFPALGGLLFGYDIGSTSYVLTQIQDSYYSGVDWSADIKDSSLLRGFFTSAVVGGALLGTLLIFKVENILGRRKELLIAACLYMMGGLLEFTSSFPSLGRICGLTIMLIGRVIYGVGVGFAMHAAPAYIAEMSPPSARGLMISAKEGAIVLGILLGQVVGFLFRHYVGSWRWTYGITIPIAIIMFIGVSSLPPSARWLALQGRYEEAEASLKFFMITGAGAELNNIRRNCEEIRNQPKMSVFEPKFRWQLFVGLGAVTFQQLTAQPSILYYSSEIFNTAGLADESTLGVGAFKFLTTMMAVFTVDRYGRRGLLLIGIIGMLVALAVLTGSFLGYDGKGSDARDAVIITSVLLLVGAYQVGFGPVSWILVSEIFPMSVRGQTVALAVSCNFFFNLLVTFLFDPIREQLGTSLTFLIFTFIDAIALLFVFMFVPETKGLSLEEIEKLFSQRGRIPISSFINSRSGSGTSPSRPRFQENIERLLPVGDGEARESLLRSSGSAHEGGDDAS